MIIVLLADLLANASFPLGDRAATPRDRRDAPVACEFDGTAGPFAEGVVGGAAVAPGAAGGGGVGGIAAGGDAPAAGGGTAAGGTIT